MRSRSTLPMVCTGCLACGGSTDNGIESAMTIYSEPPFASRPRPPALRPWHRGATREPRELNGHCESSNQPQSPHDKTVLEGFAKASGERGPNRGFRNGRALELYQRNEGANVALDWALSSMRDGGVCTANVGCTTK